MKKYIGRVDGVEVGRVVPCGIGSNYPYAVRWANGKLDGVESVDAGLALIEERFEDKNVEWSTPRSR
jgi:hypothetical protein